MDEDGRREQVQALYEAMMAAVVGHELNIVLDALQCMTVAVISQGCMDLARAEAVAIEYGLDVRSTLKSRWDVIKAKRGDGGFDLATCDVAGGA